MDVEIWPTGLRFEAGETLKLKIASNHFRNHKPDEDKGKKKGPPFKKLDMLKMVIMSLPMFGGIKLPMFGPGKPNLQQGCAVIHTGGKYDSHLLVPMRKDK